VSIAASLVSSVTISFNLFCSGGAALAPHDCARPSQRPTSQGHAEFFFTAIEFMHLLGHLGFKIADDFLLFAPAGSAVPMLSKECVTILSQFRFD
jgi:hypothetical protein